MESLSKLLAPFAAQSELYLERWLVEPGTPAELAEAMRYCVLAGGKRLRPALVLMVANTIRPGEVDELTARSAVAIELVHCYSLVHDDLPAMDNDKLRRGQPTAHVRFGEAMAILLGDALLTRAFGVLAEAIDENSPEIHADRVGLLVGELARGAGPAGMVAGQVADLELCEVPPGDEGLHYIHVHKTAALIRSAARMGAICVGSSKSELEAITEYGESLGLGFQVIDDLLDITAKAEVLGKTPGKDQTSGKRTHPAEIGLDRTRQLAHQFTQRAAGAIAVLGKPSQKLQTLAELLAERGH